MRYTWQHIKTIIETYKGEVPLAHFLKNYFKQYPILGSRDRKALSAMAYSWYRCVKGIVPIAIGRNWESGIGSSEPIGIGMEIEELVKACMRLCGNEALIPFNNREVVQVAPKEVLFNREALFPFDVVLSAGIDKDKWLGSMLIQPDLFIRIRKDAGKVTSLLNAQQIPFTFITNTCMALPNGAKVDVVLPEDTYVVQDASSQYTGTFFEAKKNELWYDCCSGAGGKSLLLKDLEPGVRLTVSDRRESIIHNLKQRFRQYRYEPPVAHVTDVTDKAQLQKALGTKLFDNIICDAPCSGSGTWARTPEQLYFFDAGTIEKFAQLQQTIAINAADHLKPGGRLVYITCSVFSKENEEVVAAIMKATGLQLQHQQVINGIGHKADSMFVAVLTKIYSM